MTEYALLIAPSANRVYAQAATRLTRAELAIFAAAGVLDSPLTDIAERIIGGLAYVTFTARLTERDLSYLSNLSAAYALFARVDRPGAAAHEPAADLLRPVELRPRQRFDSDLITIPKYAGKTNEQFTRLLLNVTVLASARAAAMFDRQLVVLDPLCGRGTTLNQALMYGYDGIGVDIDGKDVDAYWAFLRSYLKRKRLKHTARIVPVRRDRRLVARRFEMTLSGPPAEHRAEATHQAGAAPRAGAEQRVTVLHTDTLRAREVLKPGCADVIVADAPYGVAHGSRTPDRGLSRRPLELLTAAAPVWAQLLRSGGAFGMSWNTQVTGRADAIRALADAGLHVVESDGYLDLAHRVDQGIHRDVIVARKT